MDGSLVALYGSHAQAEEAASELIRSGLDRAAVSIAGLGRRLDAPLSGFESTKASLRSWGKTGEFWGGMWAVGSTSLYLPGLGSVVLGGSLARLVTDILESGDAGPGTTVVGTALIEMGVPRERARDLEAELRRDRCLLLVTPPPTALDATRRTLSATRPAELRTHVPERVPAVAGAGSFAAPAFRRSP